MTDKQMKALYQEIEIPKELDEMINKTIETATIERQESKGHNRSSRFKRLAALGLSLSFLVIPLNTSKTVASFAADIPVIGQFAKLFTFRAYHAETDNEKIQVEIPNISGLEDPIYQEKVNRLIQERVDQALAASEIRAAEYKEAFIETGGTEADYNARKIEAEIGYETYSNNGQILSFLVYGYESLAAAYATYDYYNIDLVNNESLSLKDLLGEEANDLIRQAVTDYIMTSKDRIGYTEEALNDQWLLREDIDFYVDREGQVIVVFNKYELASGADGRLSVPVVPYKK